MGRQILIAEGRAGRPNDFGEQGPSGGDQASRAECPFCVGHESSTPNSLLVVAGASGSWQVRVVPNKFPAVSLEQNEFVQPVTSALGSVPQQPEGAHEVFIESPQHVQDITELSRLDFTRVLQVYRDRLLHWSTDERVQQAMVFKNVGVTAGASLEHIHSQLVALPNIPPVVAAELQGAKQYYADHQACVFCQLIDEELKHCQRLIVENGPYVAFCAFAGRQPYETWILPRQHCANFEQLSDSDMESLAELLQHVVRRLQTQLKPLAYNLILHTAPFGPSHAEHYHWHFELVPRSTELAGFEWGTGIHINPLSPERAATKLRSAGG